MGRPHGALIELAAGRGLRDVPAGEADSLVASALEHRMSGVLWTAICGGETTLPAGAMATLAKHDLRVQAKNRALWRTLDTVQNTLASLGIQVAVAKGIAAELRWYTRLGERPCNDLDLLLEPAALNRVEDVVRALEPGHTLVNDVRELMTSGMLQSIDLTVDGVEVDLHGDVLKYEIPSRQRQRFWDETVALEGPEGIALRALRPEMSLIHFLLHLNKDNFARLLSYADVARILRGASLDWELVDELVSVEGLGVHVYGALEEVVGVLDLPRPPTPRVHGPRASLWAVLWPSRHRLQGRLGVVSHTHRPMWISLTAAGRLSEALRWWLRRRVFPPRTLVALWYADTSGPYLWRLVVGRWRAFRRNARVAAAVRRGGADQPEA